MLNSNQNKKLFKIYLGLFGTNGNERNYKEVEVKQNIKKKRFFFFIFFTNNEMIIIKESLKKLKKLI